jgi:hypothetical protein
VICLFFFLFEVKIDFVLLSVAFMYFGIFFFEPLLPFFLLFAIAWNEPMHALVIVGAVVGYVLFFWFLVQIMHESREKGL